MDLHTIYKDDNIKIEIFEPLHNFFCNKQVRYLELVRPAREIVCGEVYKDLIKKKVICKNRLISSNVPILIEGRLCLLEEPFDVFDKILEFLSCIDIDKNHLDDVAAEIESFSTETEHFYCKFFPTPLFRVHGYVAYKADDDNLIILLFHIKKM